MKKKQEQQNKTLNIKKENWKQFTLILLAIIAINIISGFVFHRFDLTKEKRFTLSASTKNMLKNLDDVVYVKVYLYGKNLPADFQELSLKTRELLDEMRAYSDNIEYEFIDPTKGKSGAELKAIYGELYQKGLRPQAIQSMESDGVSTHYIVPGALVCYQSFEVPVQCAISRCRRRPIDTKRRNYQLLHGEVGIQYEQYHSQNHPPAKCQSGIFERSWRTLQYRRF